jgi:sugar phosphate isomerase/epimerase
MRLGISTYTYGWAFDARTAPEPLTETGLLELAQSLEVSLIQVGDNLPLHRFTPARLNAFSDSLCRQGVTAEIGARGLRPEHLRRYIAICREMGSHLLRFVIDEQGYEPSAEEVVAIIRSHLDLLEQHDITLAIENHDRWKARELAGIMDAVDSSYAGICLDTANSLGAGEGIDAVLQTLVPYTVNLHLKDVGVERLRHKQGFMITGRIAGQGQLDLPDILGRVRGSGGCRSCVLEQWVPPESDVMETLAKERDWARQSIGYLKSIL